MRIAFLAGLLAVTGVFAGDARLCDSLLARERYDLADDRLAVALAKADFAAYEEIYALIEALWKQEAVQRMTWLRARYDRDAARHALEAADRLLERRRALIDEMRRDCPSREDRRPAAAILRAECARLAHAADAAATDLEFRKEWAASIHDLRERDVATRQQVILAELDVRRAGIRLADARERAAGCAQNEER